MSSDEVAALEKILHRERQARKEAERLLEERSRALWNANEKLKALAESLERRVDQRTRQLATQNSLLAALLENIESGILFEAEEGQGLLVNRRLSELFGVAHGFVERAALSNRQFAEVIRHRFRDGDGFVEVTSSLDSTAEPRVNDEWELRDGRWIRRSCIPLYLDEEYKGAFWVYDDITDQRILEESRRVAEEAAEAKSVFLANMSHEIRTPLNGIIGMNRLLIDEALNQKQMQYAKGVEESAEILLRIINDILDFSKIEAGKMELEIVEFSMKELIDGVVGLVQVKAINQGLGFNVIYDPGMLDRLQGDPGRLQQVLLNLASNAVKFTEDGDVSIILEASERDEKGRLRVRIKVEDSGIGMSSEALAALFQPFAQADASFGRRFGGTGLGLVISRSLLDLMDGKIEVKSELGRGSTFSVEVPLFPASSPAQRGVFVQAKERCLVTACSLRQRQSLSSVMRCEGLDTQETGSIDEAVKLLLQLGAIERVLWILSFDDVSAAEVSRVPRILAELGDRVIPLLLFKSQNMKEVSSFGSKEVMGLPVSRKALLFRAGSLLGLQGLGDEDGLLVGGERQHVRFENFRVLLAEDNVMNQRVGRATLENMGVSVDVAANGHEALRMLDHIPYDLVLMDIRMPEMDGVEATRRIREMGISIPVVALTANAMKGDRERFLGAGMDAYLSKPLMRDQLIEVLSLVMEGKVMFSAMEKPRPDGVEDDLVVNRAQLADMLGGDWELVGTVLRDYRRQVMEGVPLIRESAEAGHWREATALAHKLAGSSYSAQGLRLAKALSSLEVALRNGVNDMLRLAPMLEAIEFESLQIDQWMNDEYGDI